jgi:hypothetical protein
MSIACDPTSLVSGAACLECGIPPGLQKPIIISLLAQIAGVPVNATTLIANAACLECGIPPGMQDAIINYLLCQIANGGASIVASPQFTIDSVSQTSYVWAHGLASTPRFAQAFLVCASAVGGYNVGDAINVFSITASISPYTNCLLAKDATNIILNAPYTFKANEANYLMTQGGGGNYINLTATTDWRLQFVAIL